MTDDIVSTLQSHNLLKYYRGNYMVWIWICLGIFDLDWKQMCVTTKPYFQVAKISHMPYPTREKAVSRALSLICIVFTPRNVSAATAR